MKSLEVSRLMVCVVGNDHYNTLNVVRALGREGFWVAVFIIKDTPGSFVLKSRYVDYGKIIKREEVVKELVDWSRKAECIIPLIPTYDGIAALIDNNSANLTPFFILPSADGGRQGAVQFEMNKDRQVDIARTCGFDVPETTPLNLKNVNRELFDTITFPCLVKPRVSFKGAKSNFRICRDKKSLESALNDLKTEISDVLVQQFIPNDEVILIGGVRTMEKDCVITGEINKFKHSNNNDNMGLCCLGFWQRETPLAGQCKEYLDRIDYCGCFSFEFIRTRDINGVTRNYFIELNLRTDGLFYFYTKAGVNFPAIWASSCLELPYTVSPSMRKIYGMNEFLYIKNNLGLTSLRDICKTDVFSTLSVRDVKPFIYRCLYR